jgi:hypothetical protein
LQLAEKLDVAAVALQGQPGTAKLRKMPLSIRDVLYDVIWQRYLIVLKTYAEFPGRSNMSC